MLNIRWLRAGFSAVLDQGLFAGSNFILSVLLARWLTIEDYGAFTVAYAVFWVVLSFHTALLSEPMAVFGAGRFKDRLPEYLGTLLYGQLGYGVLSSLLVLMLSLYFMLSDSRVLSSALLGLALASPFMLFLYLMRRACYVHLKPQLGALASALYLIMTLVGIYLLYRIGELSPAAAFGLMGLTGLATGTWLAVRLRVARPSRANDELRRAVIRRHWDYGRWSTPTYIAGNLAENSFYFLLPIWGGLAATGALRALMTLVLPVVHVLVALSTLLLPSLARARGQNEFRHLMRLSLLLFLLGTAFYGVMLGLFNRPLISWLYGDQYVEYANLLWLVALIPVVSAVRSVFTQAILAFERPNQVFIGQVGAAIVMFTVGLGLMAIWDVAGAILANVASLATLAAILVLLWIRSNKQEGTLSAEADAGGQDPN
jgi:O-antigen/teichoic acid export membrane protein